MSEATIVVPLLAIILGGLMYIHDIYGAKLDAASEARQCALAASSSGCDGRASGGCDSDSQRLSLSGEISRTIPVVRRLVRELQGLPRVGRYFADLDEVLRIAQQTSRDVRLPEVIADTERRVGDSQRYICGEKTRGMPRNLIDRLFCHYAPTLC